MKHSYIAKRFQSSGAGLSLDTEALAKYKDIIDLSIGDTDFTTDESIINAAFRDAKAGHTHYGDPKGDPELIDAVCRAWEEDFGQRLPRDHVLVSASSCLGMALVMLAILDPGDEVIVFSPYFPMYREQIELAGGVCVDVPTYASEDYAIDEARLRAAITPRTKAIIPVDVGGILCDYTRIFSIVEDRRGDFSPASPLQAQLGRIAVIADGAHSFGAVRGGIRSGAWADFTTFSFHAVKNLTTAEGGAVTWRRDLGLDDAALYRRYMLLSLHGQDKDALAKTKAGAWEYDIVAPLYKCNMTDIMAAIGLAQLHRYEELLAKRYALVEQYHELLASTAIRPARHLTEDGRSSCHLYLTELEGKTLSQRNAVIDALAQQGIASNVHYKPLPLLTAYRDLGFRMEDYPNAYGLYERELTLPLYSTLTQAQAERICGALREIL